MCILLKMFNLIINFTSLIFDGVVWWWCRWSFLSWIVQHHKLRCVLQQSVKATLSFFGICCPPVAKRLCRFRVKLQKNKEKQTSLGFHYFPLKNSFSNTLASCQCITVACCHVLLADVCVHTRIHHCAILHLFSRLLVMWNHYVSQCFASWSHYHDTNGTRSV